MILRAAAALQDRYARFRLRKYRAPLPRIAHVVDDPGIRAYMNAVRYRKYRPYVLAAVVVYMAGRRVHHRPEHDKNAPPSPGTREMAGRLRCAERGSQATGS